MAACDLSEYSPFIIERAGQLSDALSASLTIVNVINQRDVDVFDRVRRRNIYSGKEITLDKYIKEEKEGRIDQLKVLIKHKGYNYLSPEIIIRTGIPFQAILKATEKENSDLLVIGTRGRSNISGMLLGSTAEKIFRHCPVPLLSLRLPKLGSEDKSKLPLTEFNYDYSKGG